MGARARPFVAAFVRLTWGILVLCAIVSPQPQVEAQTLSDAECARLLSRDSERSPASVAATRNLTASELRAPGASDRRRVSELVRDAGSSPPEQLCRSLALERVRNDVLLTGYYRPIVPARRSRDDEFRVPLHGLPEPSLRTRTRAEIDRGALEAKAPVVAWLADPIEAFFIHVQGSAVLELPDGRMTIGYAGSNGRPYTSIGAQLVRDGRMRREEVTMATLKAYLRDHPSDRDAILHTNERYIYFRQVGDEAIGSLGVPLTDGRSVAADPGVYPPGALVLIDSSDAAEGIPPRLAFVQDQGSAITGPARLDLYVGTGDEAGRIAGPLQQRVSVYVVRAK
jgi:membrane-bound lytic murein transglycosylase